MLISLMELSRRYLTNSYCQLLFVFYLLFCATIIQVRLFCVWIFRWFTFSKQFFSNFDFGTNVRTIQSCTTQHNNISIQVENGDELLNFLHENVRNPLKLTLARGAPNYTNYTADFKDVIDYILCDNNSTVSRRSYDNIYFYHNDYKQILTLLFQDHNI